MLRLSSRSLRANLRPSVAVFPAFNRPQIRFKSEITQEIGKLSESATEGVSEALTQIAAVAPDQVGYFASLGLAKSWVWPSGVFEHIFEYAHVYTGLPWWATILTVTIGTRLLMLPLYISSSNGTAKMARIKPELNAIMERTKVATEQREIQKCMIERKQLMAKHNVKITDMIKPLASVPIFLGVFGALSNMASHHVAGLSTDGLFWFTNLAAPDPYLGLQVMTAVLYAVTFKVFGGETGAANLSPVMKKLFTWMPFVAVPLTMGLPAAVCFYFAINGTFSIFQSNLLKNAWVRRKLDIAPMVTKEEQKQIDLKLATKQSDSVIGALRQKYEDAKQQAEKKIEKDQKEKVQRQEAEAKKRAGYVQFKK